MAGTTPYTRETKAGKMSFMLPEDLKRMIIMSIDYRIDYDLIPNYLQHLLEEAKETLRKEGRTKMRKSEFFAVFHPEQMRYFESETMFLIRAHLGDLIKKPLPEKF